MKFTIGMLLLLLLVIPIVGTPPTPQLEKAVAKVPWSDLKTILQRIEDGAKGKNEALSMNTPKYTIPSTKISTELTSTDLVTIALDMEVHILSLGEKENSSTLFVPFGVDLSKEEYKTVLKSITVNKKKGTLYNDNGTLMIPFTKVGQYTVRLEYDCAVYFSQEESSIRLSLPETATLFCNISIPQKNGFIKINNEEMVTQVDHRGTLFKGAIIPHQAPLISYSYDSPKKEFTEEITVPKKEIEYISSLNVMVKESKINYYHTTEFQNVNSTHKTFTLLIPDSLALEKIHAPRIKQWRKKKKENATVLEVETIGTHQNDYTIELLFTEKIQASQQKITLPVITPFEIQKGNGFIAIHSDETMGIEEDSVKSELFFVNRSELPDHLHEGHTFKSGYKYTKAPYQLTFTVKRLTSVPVLVTLADELLFSALYTEEGYLLSRYRYYVRNNHRQFLEVSMPSSYQLWSTIVDQMSIIPARHKKTGNVIIPLKKMATGSTDGFVVELVYFCKLPEIERSGTFRLNLPTVNINCQNINGYITTPKNYPIESSSGNLSKTLTPTMRFLHNKEHYKVRTVADQSFVTEKKDRKIVPPIAIKISDIGETTLFSKGLTIAGEKGYIELNYSKNLFNGDLILKILLLLILYSIALYSLWLIVCSFSWKKLFFVGIGSQIVLFLVSKFILYVNNTLTIEILYRHILIALVIGLIVSFAYRIKRTENLHENN